MKERKHTPGPEDEDVLEVIEKAIQKEKGTQK